MRIENMTYRQKREYHKKASKKESIWLGVVFTALSMALIATLHALFIGY